MQMRSMDQQYQQQQQQQQGGMQGANMGAGTGGPLGLKGRGGGHGQQGLQDMAEQMARGYGLNFSRGSLVDAQGNFMMSPDQLAGAGGKMDVIAADMNRIAQAINDRQVEMQQDKATAALQAGAGLIQARGRGSLAALQSNFYQAMAQNYTDPNLLPEQQDFSFWIQKAGFDEAAKNRGGTGGSDGKDKPFHGAKMSTRSVPGQGNASFMGPTGRGDVVTYGPHAGQRPVYTHDPINKTTRVTWETP